MIPKSGNPFSDKITRENGVIQVQRCTDVSRAREIHGFTKAIFAALVIDPPSSVLKEGEADFAARLRDENCFIVEENGRLIASMFCKRDGEALYVGRLAVAPEYRRRGIANALIEAAKEEARRLGLKRITLGARITLPGNVALFRRHGFVVVRETCHPGFSQPTSYDMELRLA